MKAHEFDELIRKKNEEYENTEEFSYRKKEEMWLQMENKLDGDRGFFSWKVIAAAAIIILVFCWFQFFILPAKERRIAELEQSVKLLEESNRDLQNDLYVREVRLENIHQANEGLVAELNALQQKKSENKQTLFAKAEKEKGNTPKIVAENLEKKIPDTMSKKEPVISESRNDIPGPEPMLAEVPFMNNEESPEKTNLAALSVIPDYDYSRNNSTPASQKRPAFKITLGSVGFSRPDQAPGSENSGISLKTSL